jgi:cation transport ATPase-like protein
MNRLPVIHGLCRILQVTNAASGLTTTQAQLQLAKDGLNAIVDVSQNPVWRAIKKLWAPVPWMLEAAIMLQLGLVQHEIAVRALRVSRLTV